MQIEQNRILRHKPIPLQPFDFDKEFQNIHQRKESLYNKWWWEKWISTFFQSLTLYYYQFKEIKTMNVRSETVKLLQERVRRTVEHIGRGNNFLKRTPSN
jgi:hypothetical protein